MPTWIPDWAVPHACSRIGNPSACWDPRAQARYLGQGVLAAKGYVAAVNSLAVLSNDPCRISDAEVDDLIRSLIVPEFGSNFLKCSDKVDALCRTAWLEPLRRAYSASCLKFFELGAVQEKLI